MLRRTISKRHIVGTYFPSQLNSKLTSIGRTTWYQTPSRQDDPHCRREIQGDCDCLSDSVRRDKYNEFDPKASAPEGGYIDPEGVFGAIFGGERFVPIIGTISLAKDMKSALYRKPRTGQELMKIVDNRLKGDISYLRKRRRGKTKKGG